MAQDVEELAYAAFDRGDLEVASGLFLQLIESEPDAYRFHYMRGLAHKYLRDWPTSLQHNLRSQQLQDTFDEASAWNAGIAATALGDWGEARQQWQRCGIRLTEGEGPIEGDFGLVSIRLNPWGRGETVFARRIDIVRARLLNVPLPESGHRLFDIVLHDGAKTGERECGDGTVPVFNALARLTPSDFRTFTAFVHCETPLDIRALQEATLPGIGYVEDWTESIAHYCLRCSYGTPHRHHHHDDDEAPEWEQERNLGIGAQSKAAVTRLLRDWASGGAGRGIDGIEVRECAPPEPAQGFVWWQGPADDDEDEEAAADA